MQHGVLPQPVAKVWFHSFFMLGMVQGLKRADFRHPVLLVQVSPPIHKALAGQHEVAYPPAT